jgi:hypothetical protein
MCPTDAPDAARSGEKRAQAVGPSFSYVIVDAQRVQNHRHTFVISGAR